MKRLRTQIATLMSWGMIPLALWSGLPTTACRCPDGSIKLFCSGAMLAGVQHQAADDHDRDVRHCCHAKVARPQSCCDHPKENSGRPCGKCKAIGRATTTVVETVLPPGLDEQACGLCFSDLLLAPSALPSVQGRNVELLDTGPPVDLVLMHHCFLI